MGQKQFMKMEKGRLVEGMGSFKGLANAAVFDRGMYIQPGFSGQLRIEKCLVKKSRKSGDLFTVEFTVVKGNDLRDAQGREIHPNGTKVTWQQSLRDPDVAFGSLKLFTYAVLGLVWNKDKAKIVKEVDPKLEKILDDASGDDNTLAGEEVCVHTYSKLTKEKQQAFTCHEWSPKA